jgi:hypothetical protein
MPAMAADPFDVLRVTLMQEVLPVGMAVVERARRGGPKDVIEAFTDSSDPLGTLKQEGDGAARSLRDSLDRLQPGLGNPVVKVTVEEMVDADQQPGAIAKPAAPTAAERLHLQQTLARVSTDLAELQQRLLATP